MSLQLKYQAPARPAAAAAAAGGGGAAGTVTEDAVDGADPEDDEDEDEGRLQSSKVYMKQKIVSTKCKLLTSYCHHDLARG